MLGPDSLDVVTDKRVELDLDEAGLSADLPRPDKATSMLFPRVPLQPIIPKPLKRIIVINRMACGVSPM